MNNINDEKNIIEMIRDKSEEADLNKILKSSFGGYTKQSVQEYLSIIRKQQQATKETFQKNLQTLFEEKESLRKINESLIARNNKLSAEYDNLSESLKNIKLEESQYSAKDIMNLKSNIVTLEEEAKVLQGEKLSLEKKIKQLSQTIEDLTANLQRSKDETAAQKEMLKVERQETKKQRDIVADLSRQLEEEKLEVKYLKSTMTEGKFAELNSKINELHEQLINQTDIIEKLNSSNKLKDKTIDILNDEIAGLKQRMSSLIQSLQISNLNNDKLLVANDLLKSQLEEEYKKSINLINEKANIAVEKIAVQNNLNALESKLTSMELKLAKQQKSMDYMEIQKEFAADKEEGEENTETE
jgi:chromosome segregation ATPase